MKDTTEAKLIFASYKKNDNLSGPQSIIGGEMINRLKGGGIKSVFIISSEPVDTDSYLKIVRGYAASGIKVYNLYLDSISTDHFRSILKTAGEMHTSAESGGFLMLSYGRSNAAVMLACYYTYEGMPSDEAVRNSLSVSGENEGTVPVDFISGFAGYSGRGGSAAAGKPAVAIASSAVSLISEKEPSADEKTGAAVKGNQMQAPPAPVSGADADEKKEKKPSEAGKKQPGDKKEKEKPAISKQDKMNDAAIDMTAKYGKFYTSIRFKLISIISLIIIFSMTGMIFLATYFFKKDNKIRVQENNHKISEIISLKIKSEIEKYEIVSKEILRESKKRAGDLEEQEGVKDIVFSAVMGYGNRKNQISGRSFFNARVMGKNQITRDDVKNAYNSSGDALLGAFRGDTVVINVSPYLERPVMAVSYPFEWDAARKVKSVIISFIRLEPMLNTFKTTGITKAIMINDRGDIIAHSDPGIVLSGGNISSLPIVKMMMKSKLDNGQTRFWDEKGRANLGSFKKIGIGGCGVIATVDEDLAFQEVYNIQRRNIYLTIIVLTSAILIVFFFGKTITTPITRLVGATKKIIQGQYSVEITPTTKDEIGQLTSTFIEMGKGLEEREKIKSAFGKFVNKEIAEAALRDELHLGGERKNVSVLFSDIRSFTSISEKLEPEEVVEFLNQYMSRMVKCIESTSGIVDKFIGDAIMAIWGTPLSRGNDTENAVNGALAMRGALIEFNRDRGGPKKPVINIGCGINTGPALAGQIGSEDRMEYTVIGDTVNLASRIEALNKPFRTDILVSQDAYELVKEIFSVEKMKKIRVKGKEDPQQIYAVLGRLDDPQCPKSLEEMRALVGMAPSDEEDNGQETHEESEVKYEIIE
ncbi:MAG: HAMP domain-containing protein [Spirochaetes bacterium]|jgi:adenylate cyclase|nr:HAMP domain-containing protein [Spirochaetota bacterium]